MLVELLMKKNGKMLFGVFLVIFAITAAIGITFAVNNLNTTIATFEKDGYALYLDGSKNSKATAYSFKQGTDYQFRESTNTISFESDKENVKVDEETIIHYSDGSLGVLKKVVGIDVSKINNNIIFYYNIYKDTKINYSDKSYNIKLTTGDEVKFTNLLMRISDNKFLLTGENVRLVFTNEEIIDFGDYVEFEYTSGNVVKIYNNEKYYQTISSDAVLLVSDIKIDLKEATVYKNNKQYISLTNLVINHDGNIDALEEEVEQLEITDGEVDVEIEGVGGNSAAGGSYIDDSGELEDTGSSDSSDSKDDEGDGETVAEDSDYKKTPQFKVTELQVTALKVDAKIEIVDEDALLSSDTTVRIIENATSKVIYEEYAAQGDSMITLSMADLDPDTEYTITATANYLKKEIEYTKTFISKIFRTEALGVEFTKSYATDSSLIIEVVKDSYSNVDSLVIELYDSEGKTVSYSQVSFAHEYSREITFQGLTSDTTYTVKMTDILCQGTIVDEGYAQKETYKTLKVKPEIGTLNYEVDKKKQQFNLSVNSVTDTDYGIQNFRYEIYDARADLATATPILSITEDDLSQVAVKVDDVKINRGVAYTYVLVVEFYDNEKTVEYSKELGTTMTLDGVEFPSVRWDEATSYVTWEQINGTIIIEDPSSAIVSDKYQVVYKNSIDVYTSTTITADTETGNIPININGLRANETYTFQVYASINLQDGNETEDSVYIGSVFVQTGEPNALVAVFSTTNNYTNAFSINFKLEDDSSGDSSLEASTLSEMTFTLYKGSTVDGEREVYKRVLDTEKDAYVSSLKSTFYDSNIIIDPTFFGAKNSDFTEDIYTLEVSKAYDYTDYKNEIPIENNTYPFKTNTYIPEIPDDPNDAVVITTITNAISESFGLEYDDNLDSNIVRGYTLSPRYNNETNTAVYIEWKTYKYGINSETGIGEYVYVEGLDKTTYFNEDGTLDPTIYYVSEGTASSINDTDTLRRGNTYYFTYKIYLDVDGDGAVDTIYPEKVDATVTLRSRALTPLKQSASVTMYPIRSTSSTYVWKYKIKDVDSTLEENKLYSQMDGSTAFTSSPNITVNDNSYNEVTFSGLTGNKAIILKKQERTIKYEEPTYETLTQEYFYSHKKTLDLSYTINIEVNQLVISINDYYDNIDLINSIAAADVIITPVNASDLEKLGTQTISGIELENENIIVDFIEIYRYLSIDIEVDVIVYYDTGNMGFELGSQYVALQKQSIDGTGNYYGYDSSSKKLVQNSIIKNSMYTNTFYPDNNKLTLVTPNNHQFNLDITIDSTGVIYENNNIILKELKQQELTSENNNVQFDMIIPGVSLLNSANKNNITALLDSAEVTAKIVTLDTVDLKDDLIYIELYQTDANGTNATYLKTDTHYVSEFNQSVIIDDLAPETNYYIQIYAYVYNNEISAYEKHYLYDVDQLVVGCKYNFYTLSKVEVSNITAEIVEKAYLTKNLVIKYNLDTIAGYDRIEYKLQKLENGAYVDTDITIPNSTTFYTAMTVNVNAQPGKNVDIAYGGKYQIIITPIGYYTKDGEKTEINLGTVVYQFTLEEAQQPYLGISSSKDADNLYFRVSISDPDYIIVNGLYDVKLTDSSGNTIASYEDYSIDTINKLFTFNRSVYSLVENETYKFTVTVSLDKKNDGKTFTTTSNSRTTIFGDNLNIGTVTAAKNTDNPQNIDIIFADSYKLSTIDTIQYTVNGSGTDFYLSNKETFITTYDSTKLLYYYTIEIDDTTKYESDNVYTIGINFYTSGKLVAQTEITYYYTS